MRISIYTLTSSLHDQDSVDETSKEFLSGIETELGQDLVFRGADFSTYGQGGLDLVFVRTGGSEGIFRQVFPQLEGDILLLTSGKSNSLAASMEILSFLNRQGREGEILHGDAGYIAGRIRLLAQVRSAREKLRSTRLGIIGQPSDWLISSSFDRDAVNTKTGIELVDIPIKALLEEYGALSGENPSLPDEAEKVRMALETSAPELSAKYAEGAFRLYRALKNIIKRERLSGLTLRCFDLLDAIGNTGCLALALLNAEGLPAGCEGDVPTLLTMTVGKALTGFCGFQANPSRINPRTGEILMAHCTIPLDMVYDYSFNTHFESGIGVAIHGKMKEGPVTVCKLSGDLSRSFCAAARLVKNQYEAQLCRTQISLETRPELCSGYFLSSPIGNHHVVLPGDCSAAFEAFVRSL